MNWKDFTLTQPTNKGYYLCQKWVVSCNQYGNSLEYDVLYFDGESFPNYPYLAFSGSNLMEHQKITWWCEIDEPPRNEGHFKYPENK